MATSRDALSPYLLKSATSGVASWCLARHAGYAVGSECFRKLQHACVAIFCGQRGNRFLYERVLTHVRELAREGDSFVYCGFVFVVAVRGALRRAS